MARRRRKSSRARKARRSVVRFAGRVGTIALGVAFSKGLGRLKIFR